MVDAIYLLVVFAKNPVIHRRGSLNHNQLLAQAAPLFPDLLNASKLVRASSSFTFIKQRFIRARSRVQSCVNFNPIAWAEWPLSLIHI